MKLQAHKPFDHTSIPDDLCPIATQYNVLNTGDWRAERPVVDRDRCVKCGTCWVFCPTQCITEKAAWFEANLGICKGCGICAAECPHHAINMQEETED